MGSDQQFCLRWNNFQSSLLNSLPQLLDGDDLTDVTLCAGGRNLRAHRVVLSACSPYFKDLFKEMHPFQHPVIVLPQTTFPDLCALVTFMYSGEVNIYEEQLAGLLAVADSLHIRGLAEVPRTNGVPHKSPSGEINNKEVGSTPVKKQKLSPSTPILPLNKNLTRSPLKQQQHKEENSVSRAKEICLDDMMPSETAVRVKVEKETNLSPMSALLGSQEAHSSGKKQNVVPMPVEEIDIGDAGFMENCNLPVGFSAESNQGHSSSEDSGGGTSEEKFNIGQGVSLIPRQHLPLSRQSINCPVCGKLISQQRNLRQHMRVHQKQTVNEEQGAAIETIYFEYNTQDGSFETKTLKP